MTTFVLIGPESTGKTWLSGLLAGSCQASWRPEYLREYYDKYNGIEAEQMEIVARRQIEQEKELFALNLPVVFLDTNIITIKIYYEYYFKKKATWFDALYQPQLYTHYFLLSPEGVPWVEDPQRDSPEVREMLFHHFKKELDCLHVDYTVISGSYEERITTIKREVEKALPEFL